MSVELSLMGLIHLGYKKEAKEIGLTLPPHEDTAKRWLFLGNKRVPYMKSASADIGF